MDDECACYTLTPDLENLAEESLADLGEVLNGMIQVSPSGGDVHAKLSYTAMRDQIEKLLKAVSGPVKTQLQEEALNHGTKDNPYYSNYRAVDTLYALENQIPISVGVVNNVPEWLNSPSVELFGGALNVEANADKKTWRLPWGPPIRA